MNERERQLTFYETDDGSTTLLDESRDLHFRSRFGARTESNTVFVLGTRPELRGDDWTIVELGFGGGLNFCETVSYARETGVRHLRYVAVEKDLVPPEFIDHPSVEVRDFVRDAVKGARQEPRTSTVRSHVFATDSGGGCTVDLHLHLSPWQDTGSLGVAADAVYHDPFGPRDNPDCWTVDCFRWQADNLAESGVLGTYSAASAVRAAMFSAGLKAASAPGPGRKREITFAARDATVLEPYDLLPPSRYADK